MHEWLQLLREFWNSIHTGLIDNLGPWTYVALMILVATEGPLSTLVGAAAAATDLLDVRWVLLATIAGNITGDVVWYSLGYLHKLDTLLHYGKWLGVKQSHLDRLETQMHAHATKMIILAKVAYGLIVPTLVAAGLARVPWRKWFPVVFVVETLWSLLLVFLGYHMTGYIAELERGAEILIGIVWIAAISAFVVWLRRRRRRQRSLAEQTETSVAPWSGESQRPLTMEGQHDARDTGRILTENGTSASPTLGSEATEPAQSDLRGEPVADIGGKGQSA